MNTAIKPVLRYVGSKYYIRKDILKILESVPHQTFVEVFGGSGIITACKDPVKQEVCNDYNKHVSTFFSVLVDPGKFDELQKRLEFLTYNEKIFKDAKAALATDDGTLSDVDIAFCLFVTSLMAFGGKHLAPSFGVTVTNRSYGSALLNKIKYIKQWHERFTRVQITNKDWWYCLNHFDREYVLFYLDPPSNCRWATATTRRWSNCASCRVIECRCPTALANGVGSLGVGQTRVVPGADYIEVRSGSCNASACSNWRL